MAGRKRSSAEDIVRKLRRADELAAEGDTGEEIAAELQVTPATLYNWRRTYGVDTDAAKELKELRERNARLNGDVNLNWPRCDDVIWLHLGRVGAVALVSALAAEDGWVAVDVGAKAADVWCEVEEGHRGYHRDWSAAAVSAS
ncbi:transposase [Williamsia sp.]|uniref:transposase n=1 Tax=Williamsia sp. TaxID=1872085 RepID=UPI002F953CBE